MPANPLFSPFTSPRGAVPFSAITPQMMEQAMVRGMERGAAEVQAIASSTAPPTFDNTILALSRSGDDLTRACNVFFPLLSALSSEPMEEIAMRISPRLSDYSTSITLNRDLWLRVKAVYDSRASLSLDPEDERLLSETYLSFIRAGALLEGEARQEMRAIRSELSELTTRFGQNVLKELHTYKIYLSAEELEGLPESSVEAAAFAAKEDGHEGSYLFTLDQPVYSSFLKHSARRHLRERFWRLYNARNMTGEFDNVPLAKRIAALRLRLARLMGHHTYAEMSLSHTMAGSPAAVDALLDRLARAYTPAWEAERRELLSFAATIPGAPSTLMPWDYAFYAEKLRQAKYEFNDEELRPYFELDAVISGVFGLATRLYGITFAERHDLDVYHPDVRVYEVTDADGSFLGLFYADFFPRPGKRPGAWMTAFREQRMEPDGTDTRPLVSIVTNFTKPTDTRPSLLTPSEVGTFLHEFGHSLHGLLSRCRHEALSGTSVYRDFVELPSQFNENFLTQREFLDSFARHYLTGEPIPAEAVERMVSARRFGAAYSCLRQLSFGLIDMAWHSITAPVTSASALEREAAAAVSVFPPVDGALVSPQFSHIFAGGYAAGYYSYKWSEVLDADAFSRFEQEGVFNPDTAASFRREILEKGGTRDPALLYRRFRGRDATIDALLRRDGILPPTPPSAS